MMALAIDIELISGRYDAAGAGDRGEAVTHQEQDTE